MSGRASSARSGFTIVDVLVSMAVIAVLISLLLPSISGVRELTRRVVCASNARQHGLGLAMFLEDSKGQFPPSKFQGQPGTADKGLPQNMMFARTGVTRLNTEWDGMGILYISEYLNAPQVFYCPSHTGDHPYTQYAALWPMDTGEIVINYQYRGNNFSPFAQQPDRVALITDGMQTISDFSHRIGANVLRADYSVKWFSDPGRTVASSLPMFASELAAGDKIESAWTALDAFLAPIPLP